jgi:aspartokinase-like uncharacterized kinase
VRVIVCGGRDYADRRRVVEVLAGLPEDTVVVHGAARGADRIAGEVATSLGLRVEAHPANWRCHGKAAGPLRNRAMLAAGVDLVVAFPGGSGSADMVRRARRAGIHVVEVLP